MLDEEALTFAISRCAEMGVRAVPGCVPGSYHTATAVVQEENRVVVFWWPALSTSPQGAVSCQLPTIQLSDSLQCLPSGAEYQVRVFAGSGLVDIVWQETTPQGLLLSLALVFSCRPYPEGSAMVLMSQYFTGQTRVTPLPAAGPTMSSAEEDGDTSSQAGDRALQMMLLLANYRAELAVIHRWTPDRRRAIVSYLETETLRRLAPEVTGTLKDVPEAEEPPELAALPKRGEPHG